MELMGQDPYVLVKSKPVYHFTNTSHLEQFHLASSFISTLQKPQGPL